MDFPKSVPGVGLVADRFVDENPVAGTPGSLIPAAWGNAVTLEILAVIQAAGLTPTEGNTAQLLAAIQALAPASTETARGLIELATSAEVLAGSDAQRAVSPARLAEYFSKLAKFQAYQSTLQSVSAAVATKILFQTEQFDIGGVYNNANSRFVAPANGYYCFYAGVHFTGSGSSSNSGYLDLFLNGSQARRMQEQPGTFNSICGSSGPIYMSANDYAEIYAGIGVSGNTNPVYSLTWFAGERIS